MSGGREMITFGALGLLSEEKNEGTMVGCGGFYIGQCSKAILFG